MKDKRGKGVQERRKMRERCKRGSKERARGLPGVCLLLFIIIILQLLMGRT